MSLPLPRLPARDPLGHKGTFGTVCVLGGQAARPRVMIGAPAFAASAALRCGAGLAVLAVPEPIIAAALMIAPNATGLALPVDRQRVLRPSGVAELLDTHLPRCDCLAVGTGWGEGEAQQKILYRLLTDGGRPMVVDADGLNALAALGAEAGTIRGPVVLTPHPGEFARIAGALGVDADPRDPAGRPAAAGELARRLGCVVVLKGAGTVISDGHHDVVNETGNAALATAGTGDVLTGMIAGLVAQFFEDGLAPGDGTTFGGGGAPSAAPSRLSLLECASLGVHLHGRAADLWAARHGSAGLSAEDLIACIPETLAEQRARPA